MKLGKFKGPTVNNLNAFKLRSLFYFKGNEKRERIVFESILTAWEGWTEGGQG